MLRIGVPFVCSILNITGNTVRPRDTLAQAAWTLQVQVFELGPKNLSGTNLCSENLEQHGFLFILPSPYLVTKIARILSCTSFFFPKKRASQGLTVVHSVLVSIGP